MSFDALPDSIIEDIFTRLWRDSGHAAWASERSWAVLDGLQAMMSGYANHGHEPGAVSIRCRRIWQEVTSRFPCFRSTSDFYGWVHKPDRRFDLIRRLTFLEVDAEDCQNITTALTLLLPSMTSLVALDCPAPVGRSARAFTRALNSLAALRQLCLRHPAHNTHYDTPEALPHHGPDDKLGVFDHSGMHCHIRTLHLRCFTHDIAFMHRPSEHLPHLNECVLYDVMYGEEVMDWIMRSAENVKVVDFTLTGQSCSTESWGATCDVDVLLTALRRRRTTLACLHVELDAADTPLKLSNRRYFGDEVVRSMNGLRALELCGKGIRVSRLHCLGQHVQLLGLRIDAQASQDNELLLKMLAAFSRSKQLVTFCLLDDVDHPPDVSDLRDIFKAIGKELHPHRAHINEFRALAGLHFH